MDSKSFPEPTLEKQLKGHRNGITALSYSPNNQQIASSSLDNSVLSLRPVPGHRWHRPIYGTDDEAVMDVTFSPSGKYMASASRDKSVRIWVPTVTGSTGVFKAHSQTVRSVEFSPDATKIITASDDKIVKLWSSDKLKFVASFVGHTNWVRRASMSDDGSVIASCSDDKTTRLWSPDSGQCIHTYKDQKGHGQYVAWHPSGCYIAIGTSHGNVKLYDIRTHSLVQYYSIHSDAVSQVAFHPSGTYILTASRDGKMKILDLLEGHPIFTLSCHSGAVNAINFSPSGDGFASAGEDKLVFLWKTNFTELASDLKENVNQNNVTTPKSQVSKSTTISKGRNQDARIWYKCYHSNKYPVTTFAHVDDETNLLHTSNGLEDFRDTPYANSTMMDSNKSVGQSHISSRLTSTPPQHSQEQSFNSGTPGRWDAGSQEVDYSSHHVGNMSHIPRVPPSPATYTIPSYINRSTNYETMKEDNNIFGMIKLKDDDVCYTSGTIEWVGRKRSFPINSGFKILKENDKHVSEPLLKKIKKLDKTIQSDKVRIRECDCADVLPTVNAIVDHLNALHEAVDLVDLRLNTLEDVVSKDSK